MTSTSYCTNAMSRAVPMIPTAPPSLCSSAMLACCKIMPSYHADPTPPITCDNQTGLFWVEAWNGVPGTSGSSGISAVSLSPCDALQFWTQGTMDIDVAPGSVQAHFDAKNIYGGTGAPVLPPPAPMYSFIYYDENVPRNTWIWDTSLQIWQPLTGISGQTGINIWHYTHDTTSTSSLITLDPAYTGAQTPATFLVPVLPSQTTEGTGTRLFFDTTDKVGSFRAGATSGPQWDIANRGQYSVAFGLDNQVSGPQSTIGGGSLNSISGSQSFIGGGISNTTVLSLDVIVGGTGNTVSGPQSFIGCGSTNGITGAAQSAIVAGAQNTIVGNDNFIGAGAVNAITANRSFIGSGLNNTISPLAVFEAVIAGGNHNTVNANQAVITGGLNNSITSLGISSAIVSGIANIVSSPQSFIGAGAQNSVSGNQSLVGTGAQNTVTGNLSSIVGGTGNNALGNFQFIGGGSQNTTNFTRDVIVGGIQNTIFGPQSFIGCGSTNGITGLQSAIVGGLANNIKGANSFIGAGLQNTIAGPQNFIGVGQLNGITGFQSGIVSGVSNIISGQKSFIGGGLQNTITSNNSIIGGGQNNIITSNNSCIPGGENNTVTGLNAFMCGSANSASNNDAGIANTFIWGDISGMDLTGYSGPTGINDKQPNSVWFGCGGAGTASTKPVFTIFTTPSRANNAQPGVQLVQGGSAWNSLSDRNAKEIHTELDYETTLQKILSLPIYEYHYKGTPENMTCRGPVAQDWHNLFPSSKPPLMIDTMDLDGVTLAAVKGLALRVEQLQTIVATQQEQIRYLVSYLKNHIMN